MVANYVHWSQTKCIYETGGQNLSFSKHSVAHRQYHSRVLVTDSSVMTFIIMPLAKIRFLYFLKPFYQWKIFAYLLFAPFYIFNPDKLNWQPNNGGKTFSFWKPEFITSMITCFTTSLHKNLTMQLPLWICRFRICNPMKLLLKCRKSLRCSALGIPIYGFSRTRASG